MNKKLLLLTISLFIVVGCGSVDTDCDCSDDKIIEPVPTLAPTTLPTTTPTTSPIVEPTPTPTTSPTVEPTTTPTTSPTVEPTPNNLPIANNQKIITKEDMNISIILTAEDIDDDTLSYIVTTQPVHGTISGEAPNFTYIPNANYHGDDSFTFKVNDGSVDSMEATISIVVTPINDNPIANDDTATTKEKVAVVIKPLLNDIDTDGNISKLRIVSISKPHYGIFLLEGDSVYYTSKSDSAKQDTLTYLIEDENGAKDTATIRINILSANDAPIAYGQTIETNEEEAISFELNGTDPDGDDITYTLVNTQYVPIHGTISGDVPKLIYTPNIN